ncbi:hypothetical protein FQZ97_1076260 [compost metagenome]
MVASQVIAHLDPVHPSCTTDQREIPRNVDQGAHHLEGLDIEPFEELLDPGFIRMDVLGALLLLGQIDLDRRLEGTAQRGGTVGEGLVGLELRQWFDGALGAGTHLVHISLKIVEVVADAATGQGCEHQGAERQAGARTTHFCSPLSL